MTRFCAGVAIWSAVASADCRSLAIAKSARRKLMDPGNWATQRGFSQGMNEDFGNVDMINFFAAEVFNAGGTVVAINADKLIFLTDSQGVTDIDGKLLDELTTDVAERLIMIGDWLSLDMKRFLPSAVRASRAGVGRVHLIGFDEDGTLLRELFSRDGVGTIITRESLEILRDARPDDISGLVALIEPLEEAGVLVRRSRELLEREITRFSVVEHDGLIVGCAAIYPYGGDQAELACVAVHPHYRRWGYGEQLLKRIEARARAVNIKRLFVLTTVTAHWFKERGFVEQSVDQLPEEKRLVYNLQRRSKVFAKAL